ncbi:hypothetical protein ACHAWT_009275 [Skeletonema menzelii]
MVPSKSLALVAIIVLTLNSLLYLNTDPYLQQVQYTTTAEHNNESIDQRASTGGYEPQIEEGGYEPQNEESPGEETNEQFTLRILNRRDKERRMVDANLQDIDERNQQIMRSSNGMNEPSYICNRPADLGTTQHSKCPGSNNPEKLLLLDGTEVYGRIGNNLMEFLHALQYSRDNDIQLGVKYGSWAMRLLPRMWLSITGDQSEWEAQFERAFCIKIIRTKVELKNYDVVRLETKDLLLYKSNQSFEEYASFQQQALRTLYQNYNTGDGTTLAGYGTRDMCAGIHALFGKDSASAIYSVIHLRKLEKVGYTILAAVSRHTGCDPRAAIEMRPDYIRTILKPLRMLDYPIVVIGDGQNIEAVQRLLDDPEIGPQIVFVPEEAVWNGGDMTLGVMSNVFIGNPASSFSGFIAKSRLALGKGHNYLFRARDNDGKWQTVCGDSCVFDKAVNHF